MAIFVVEKQDGTMIELPEPKTATPGRERIHSEESGRNQKGNMFLYGVGAKFKFTNTWGPLTQDEAEIILNAIDDDRYQWFYLHFINPKTKKPDRQRFYAGPYSMPILYWHPTDEKKRKYASLSVNFIEM